MSVNIILPENFDEIYHEINTLIIDKKRRCKSQKDSIAEQSIIFSRESRWDTKRIYVMGWWKLYGET